MSAATYTSSSAIGYGKIENPTSILGMVQSGNAEMSDYVLALGPTRAQVFSNAGPIFEFPSVFVYRPPKLGYAELNIFSVIPWRISLGFIVFGIGVWGRSPQQPLS